MVLEGLGRSSSLVLLGAQFMFPYRCYSYCSDYCSNYFVCLGFVPDCSNFLNSRHARLRGFSCFVLTLRGLIVPSTLVLIVPSFHVPWFWLFHAPWFWLFQLWLFQPPWFWFWLLPLAWFWLTLFTSLVVPLNIAILFVLFFLNFKLKVHLEGGE